MPRLLWEVCGKAVG